MAKTQKDSSEQIEAMKGLFDTQRALWRKKIRRMTKWMKMPEKLTMLEMTVRNEIMKVSEEKSKLLEALIALNKIIRNKKAEHLIELKTNTDLKLKTNDEYKTLMEAHLSDYTEREELIEMQIDYLTTSFNNLKDISWGIKNYIELNKMGIE